MYSNQEPQAQPFVMTAIILTVCLLLYLVFHGLEFRKGFEFLFANLPLTLPWLTVCLSIASRPHEIASLRGFLNLSNYFALGLVSFAIWAFVAGEGVERFISVNPTTVLDKNHAIMLIVVSFTWAVLSAVTTAIAENKKSEGWLFIQAVLWAISLTLLFAPYYLLESTKDVQDKTGILLNERPFTVSIAFRDPALNQHLGRVVEPITQARVYQGILARSADEAVDRARDRFHESEESFQFLQPGRRPVDDDQRLRVEILEYLIVAQEAN